MKCSKIQCATRWLLLAACLVGTGTSWGLEVWLRTTNTTLALPDGRTVTMWAFALDSSATANDGIPSVPGPPLTLSEADASLTIHLKNYLPEPVSVVIPGQYSYDSLTPAFHTSGPYTNRVRSFTREAATNGGTAIYTWPNLQPGTYLYHSGSHPAVQVQMGLYGALTKAAPGHQVYPGIPFDYEATLLFSEIDPEVHDAVASANFGPGPQFFTTDFTNPVALINALSTSASPVAAFLWAQFPPADQVFLLSAANSVPARTALLVKDLNALLIGPSIYSPSLFPETILSAATRKLLAQAPQANYPQTAAPFHADLVRLNRLLLQDGLAVGGILMPPLKAMTSTVRSYPKYFLINGKPYTNGIASIPAGAVGRNVLLRLLNAGLDMRVPTLNNAGDARLIAEDGQPAPYARRTSAILMPALKTVDALWTPPSSAPVAIYDRRLGLVNGTQFDGGMLRYLVAAPLSFTVSPPNAAGVIQLTIFSDPGAVFRIQSTPSLSSPIIWTTIATLTNATGTLSYSVTNNPALPAIFYRAVQGP